MSWDVPGYSDAGQLDHPVTFLSFTESQNEYGEVTYTWDVYAEDWCELLPLRAGERIQAAQLQAQVDAMLRVRWRADITEQHRVRLDGMDYELVGPPVERGRHRFIELMVRRRDPGQPARAA
jgi:SPP1 family predicted phage head-tail adaptor